MEMTRSLRILLFLGIGLILLLMFLPGVLIPLFISSQIKSRTQYSMDFGNVDIHLFRGYIQLWDVKLKNDASFPVSDFIHINELKIDLNPLSLFKQEYVIEDFVLNIENIAFIENEKRENNFEIFVQRIKQSLGIEEAQTQKETSPKAPTTNTSSSTPPNTTLAQTPKAKKTFVIKHLLIEIHSLTALVSKGSKDLVRADSSWKISEEHTYITQDTLNEVTRPLTAELTKRGISLLGQILIKKTIDVKSLGEGVKNLGVSTLKTLGGAVQGLAEIITPEETAIPSQPKADSNTPTFPKTD